jgi:hypothetical protein
MGNINYESDETVEAPLVMYIWIHFSSMEHVQYSVLEYNAGVEPV